MGAPVDQPWLLGFWHAAGDEQDFDTPGSALDGWSREELSPSMAWRAVPTQPGSGEMELDSMIRLGDFLKGRLMDFFGGQQNEPWVLMGCFSTSLCVFFWFSIFLFVGG